MTDSTDPTLPADLRVGVVGMGIGHLHLLCWLGVKGASAVAIAEPDDDRRRPGGILYNRMGETDLNKNLPTSQFQLPENPWDSLPTSVF